MTLEFCFLKRQIVLIMQPFLLNYAKILYSTDILLMFSQLNWKLPWKDATDILSLEFQVFKELRNTGFFLLLQKLLNMMKETHCLPFLPLAAWGIVIYHFRVVPFKLIGRPHRSCLNTCRKCINECKQSLAADCMWLLCILYTFSCFVWEQGLQPSSVSTQCYVSSLLWALLVKSTLCIN